MNIPFNHRAQIEGGAPGGSWIAQAIETIIAAITATFGVQHNDDGSHGTITLGGTRGPQLLTGTSTPENHVTAPLGSIYLRTDGSTSTTLYVKTAGAGRTGWTAK